MITEITYREEWNAILQTVDNYDFYHTYDYHKLCANENEKSVLIVYRKAAIIIAIPVIIRSIKDTVYNDITSVYGYSGPLTKNISDDYDNSDFQVALNKYLKTRNIVSVFNRLNPFIKNQKTVLKDLGDYRENSAVVAIDLRETLYKQKQNYQRRMKSQINKARRVCTLKKASTRDDIKKFVEIYHQNMDRVNADESYYFDESYFNEFMRSKSYKSELLLAFSNDTNEAIAGALFVKTNNIVQYHLGGTKTEFLHMMPIKLIIDEMRIMATEEGYHNLNLGGGYRGLADSLLRFKMSYTKRIKAFNIWKYIVNQEVYDHLASQNETKKIDYFPSYR